MTKNDIILCDVWAKMVELGKIWRMSLGFSYIAYDNLSINHLIFKLNFVLICKPHIYYLILIIKYVLKANVAENTITKISISILT